MHHKFRFRRDIVVVLVSLTLGLVASTGFDLASKSNALNLTNETIETSQHKASISQELPDFVSLAKKIRPVVVNVSTTQVSQGRSPEFANPFGEDHPMSEFWRRFFGGPFPRGPSRQKSLGSGVIIDRNGSILTNNHVVENAEKIIVRLADGKKYEAKVVGKDPKTDLAIIKIDTKDDLPAATLGDSNRLDVGEWVLAIGNPFGLDNTVTSGIVSAKGRDIGQGPYDNFIQTDASINPGNSGGPLINLRGEVVGINTLIYSGSGGNIGIGFSIPINLAKELLPQLTADGKVTRGYLGVFIQKVTPEIAESLELDEARGALVADVQKDGPAERAGLKLGDVITKFDEKEIKNSSDLPRIVAGTPADKKVQVEVLRDKEELTLTVVVGELEAEEMAASAHDKGELGLTVQRVTPRIAEGLGLSRAEGVVVTEVEPGSSADEAGLRRRDVILEIDRKSIRNLADFRQAIKETKKGKRILFLVNRRERPLFLSLKPTS